MMFCSYAREKIQSTILNPIKKSQRKKRKDKRVGATRPKRKRGVKNQVKPYQQVYNLLKKGNFVFQSSEAGTQYSQYLIYL